MHYQIVVYTLSGNTIEGAIKPGNPGDIADKISAVLEHSDVLTVEVDGPSFVTIPVKNIELAAVNNAHPKEA